MTDDDKQAVTDGADDQQKADSEDGGAREKSVDERLDELLSQFDAGSEADDKPASDKKAEGDDDQVAKLAREIDELKRQDVERRTQTDVASACQAIRGDLDAGVFSDAHREGWLTAEAKADERIAMAWTERQSKPQVWGQVQEQLQQKFARWVGSFPDKAATEDRTAIADAVRGASKKAPGGDDVDASKVHGMSDEDFESYVASVDKKKAA